MSKKCIECGSPTHPIRVLEYDEENSIKYAAFDSKTHWFHGRYPIEGELAAELCESCGRVTFRAVPKG